MTYTTRCPACGTTFRVVPDQLKISDGWVRCGYCSDVFDATLNLQPWSGDSAEVASQAPRPPVNPPAPAGDPTMPGEPRPVERTKTDELPATVTAAAPAAPVAVAAPAVAASPDIRVPDPGLDSPTDDEPMASGWEDSDFMAELQRYARQVRAGDPSESPEPSDRTPSPAESLASASANVLAKAIMPPGANAVAEHQAQTGDRSGPPPLQRAPEPAPMPEAEPVADPEVEPGFVVQARRRAFWSSAGVRAVMLVLVLLLGTTLVGQWALHERDAVAARWPAARPALEQACERLGCTVAALQRIDDVVIDSSSLQRKLGNFYAFDLVLKNRADVPLAAPALELTLTDLRDQVIARRVFLPQEMPGMPDELPARESVSTSLRLSIALGNDATMSGFRALVFYP